VIYVYISLHNHWHPSSLPFTPLAAGSDLPIYRQIMRQAVEAIAGGRLLAGEQLPSHRDLSEQLAVAPLTVKKAYDELEELGYIETQRGRGTFVAERLPRISRAAKEGQVTEAARALLSTAYLAGLDYEDVLAALEVAARDLTEGQPPRQHRKRPA
jgi:GntR family transcriptional regulator